MSNIGYIPTSLFQLGDVEDKSVLRHLVKAHQVLGELKGVAQTMPNPEILVSTLSLQEAKDSSEIENIITTHDDLYQSHFESQQFTTHAAKEVHRYTQAMMTGFDLVQRERLITSNTIQRIQAVLEGNDAGYRKQSGTGLINEATGEVVFLPPQHPEQILDLMTELVRFINEDIDYDPLVKMALVHHQFETIHPFYDGNGRTGRIINILMLIQHDLLDTPILYLSRYINQNKSDYYRLLQSTRDTKSWSEWLCFMLKSVEQTAKQTTVLIRDIKALMQHHKHLIKTHAPKIYSHELLNNLYKYPYTKIDFVVHDCEIHRNTASKRLEMLTELGILKKEKVANENFYLNEALLRLLSSAQKI